MDMGLFQHHLLKRLSFPIELLCHLCQKSDKHIYVGVFLDPMHSIDIFSFLCQFPLFDSYSFILYLEVKYHISSNLFFKIALRGFPGGTVVENLPANAGDTGSSPGPGRSHMPRSN